MKKADSVYHIIRNYFSPAGKTVIDVGCGTGELVRQLALTGAKAYGIDKKEIIRKAKSLRSNAGEEYFSDQSKWKKRFSQNADAVIFCASLHHFSLKGMKKTIRTYAGLLRPEGLLMVLEPVALPGYYYELVRLIEDEKEILQQTYEILRNLKDPSLVLTGESHWYIVRTLDDFANLVESDVDDPLRKEQLVGIAKQNIMAHTENHPGSTILHSCIRLNLFRKVG